MTRVILLFHLLGFAAYVGAGFAQQRLLARSRAASLAEAARDELERLAAAVVTKIELPAIFVSVVSGVGSIVMTPELMRHGWLHAKLTCVLVLLVLSHLEMFNARRIVKLRSGALAPPSGSSPAAAIDTRKRRHALFGAAGTLLVSAILALVIFAR